MSSSLEKLYNIFLESNGVSTDTRNISDGQIFFALKGPNFDGNKYALQALEKGAKWAVVDDNEIDDHAGLLFVDDVLTALQDLAREVRRSFEIPFIGLTGSNGKTTTRELIRVALSPKFNVTVTNGNLNNHIGVPLTLLAIPRDTEIAVIELGANHIGEIAELCDICKPTHGIITNIGKDHMEGFGGFEGSLRANTELFEYLLKHHGRVFINNQDPVMTNLAKRFQDPVYYPQVSLIGASPFVEYENSAGEKVETKLIGDYNFFNIAAASCIANFFGVDEDKVDVGISSYVPENNRSQWMSTDKNNILMDAYNANPSSMSAAIESFAKSDFDNKVVILGDMFELGEYAEEEHEALGELVEKCHFEKIYLVGELMENAIRKCPGASHFSSKDDLERHLKDVQLSGYTILLKASRGIALETLISSL